MIKTFFGCNSFLLKFCSFETRRQVSLCSCVGAFASLTGRGGTNNTSTQLRLIMNWKWLAIRHLPGNLIFDEASQIELHKNKTNLPGLFWQVCFHIKVKSQLSRFRKLLQVVWKIVLTCQRRPLNHCQSLLSRIQTRLVWPLYQHRDR